jgi:hypothetical protein
VSWVTIITLSVIYAMCGAVVAARVATLVAWEGMRQANEGWHRHRELQAPLGGHWLIGALLGLAGGVIWPATVAVLVFRRAVFAPPLEIQAKRQADYTVELEHQLGIDQNTAPTDDDQASTQEER